MEDIGGGQFEGDNRDRPKFGSAFGFRAEISLFTLLVLVSVAAVTDSAEFRCLPKLLQPA